MKLEIWIFCLDTHLKAILQAKVGGEWPGCTIIAHLGVATWYRGGGARLAAEIPENPELQILYPAEHHKNWIAQIGRHNRGDTAATTSATHTSTSKGCWRWGSSSRGRHSLS